LLEGEISIQYQVYRDLFGIERNDLKERISKEGWGQKLLSLQKPDGHWGIKYYQPKWTSTHYTLLDLKNLGIFCDISSIRDIIHWVLKNIKSPDGGILPIGNLQLSDVCLNGMFLNFASYFKAEKSELKSIVDCILNQRMADGGFNCQSNRSGAVHSSLHSTTSVVEGISEYLKSGYSYRVPDLKEAELSSREFILLHRLFLSDRTGKIIKKEFLSLPYPWRWKYNILRGLVYFVDAGIDFDNRMSPAIEVLLKKRRKDGRWNLQAHHPGQRHFNMEAPGTPSRWNTLFALKVLDHFNIE
jgi:hypothetical protein